MFDVTEAKRLAEAARWVPVDQCPEEWKDKELFLEMASAKRGILRVDIAWWDRESSAWNCPTFPVGSGHEPEAVRLFVKPNQPDPLATKLEEAVAEIERLREALGKDAARFAAIKKKLDGDPMGATERMVFGNYVWHCECEARALGGDHGHD